MKRLGSAIGLMFIIILFDGCKQADPEAVNNRIYFSGRYWKVRNTNGQLSGPGRNYFASWAKNVWVDDQGYLHLRITKRNGRWYSSEVITEENLGYGTYTFYYASPIAELDPNTVVGLFTWDDNTFSTQANSEVDIEFAKWGNASLPNHLQYTVQPSNGAAFAERYYRPTGTLNFTQPVTTHQFSWTSSLIQWKSFDAEGTSGSPIASWSFNTSNPARIKYTGYGNSQPVIIPAPGTTTHARINFWTLGDEFGKEGGPSDGMEKEIIIKKFEYVP